MVLDVDAVRIIRNITSSDLVEGDRERLLVRSACNLDGGLQLDCAIALTAHHVVDVVRALGREGTQEETVLIGFFQQIVDSSAFSFT